MQLEFKLYKLKATSSVYQALIPKSPLNEFIVVGEEMIGDEKYLKVHQLTNEGLRLIGGVQLGLLAYSVHKDDLELVESNDLGAIYSVIDIPKEYLTVDIIETIQRLNN